MFGVAVSILLCILFTTFIFLELFTYLVEIFENTIGYFLLFSIFSNATELCSNIFKIRFEPRLNESQNCDDVDDGKLDYSATNSDTNFNFIISAMSVFNMSTLMKVLATPLETQVKQDMPILYFELNNKDGRINEKNIENLFTHLHWKHIMGHCVWMSFASLVSTFTFIKSLSNYI